MQSIPQISQYAANAGIKGVDALITAVAIALAESSGNELATHTNSNGSIDTGLWQINSIHKKVHPNWTIPWLQNPTNNAQAMAIVSNNGTNWRPWTTYNSGSYRKYIDEVKNKLSIDDSGNPITTGIETGLNQIPGIGGTLGDIFGGVTDTTSFIASIAESIARAGAWIINPDNWIRIVQVIGGVGLGLIAATVIISNSKTKITRSIL